MTHEGFQLEKRFICLQCALKLFVEELERGEDPLLGVPVPLWVEGTMDEHIAAVHPDLKATQRERADLDARAHIGFERLMRRRAAGIQNADNN